MSWAAFMRYSIADIVSEFMMKRKQKDERTNEQKHTKKW